MFCFASIQLRPNADHDMLTVERSARDLFWHLSSVERKKAGSYVCLWLQGYAAFGGTSGMTLNASFLEQRLSDSLEAMGVHEYILGNGSLLCCTFPDWS